MHVFVNVGELTGQERRLYLGNVPETTTIKELRGISMEKVDALLPDEDRQDSRHFWYADSLIVYDNKYLKDIAPAVNVTVELRPDHYQVELPGRPPARFAIDPERTVAYVIDQTMGYEDAWKCYELLPRGGDSFNPKRSLYDQGALPYHSRLTQKEAELVIRRQKRVAAWSVGYLLLAAILGLFIGFLFARFLS